MTSKAAQDYLTKELFVKRSVVTFRSLSRELNIHVNDAKNELKEFYEASQFTESPAVPTYLVSGEVAPKMKKGGSKRLSSTPDADEYYMDVDFEDDVQQDEDVVYMSKVMLVDAAMLDDTMAQLSRISSVHVYCLSPSRLTDPSLICATNVNVQKVDAARGPESFPIVGKISAAHVKMRTATGRAAASSSKTTLDVAKKDKPPPKASPQQAIAEQPALKAKTSTSDSNTKGSTTVPKNSLQKTEAKEKPKLMGKLDWSKAKTKEKVKGADKSQDDAVPESSSSKNVSATKPLVQQSSRQNVEATSSSKPRQIKSNADFAKPNIAPAQRGIKRKSQMPSDSEGDSPPEKPATASGGAKVRGGVIISDDEESDVPMPGRRRAKAKGGVTSDTDTSLREMMDIDDDQVVRMSRLSKVPPKSDVDTEPEFGSENDAEASVPPLSSDADDMDVDDEPIVKKPKKRRPAKVIPVGRNGLKKKRVVKTRTTTDAKGYIQTEDYSSYESVEESEAQSEQPAKGKGKKKVVEQPKTDEKSSSKEVQKSKPKAPPKAKVAAAKRGSLLNFFGPDKGKK